MKKIILLLIFPITIFAATPVKLLQQKLNAIQNFKADFRQTVYGDDGDVLQEISGSMAILRPGKFLWQTKNPLPQIIITDGKNLWIYEPDLKQVTKKTLNNSISTTPAALLIEENSNLKQQFSVQKKADEFILLPKHTTEAYKNITITFAGNKIKTMQIKNNLDQKIKIEFTNVETNTKSNLKLFNINLYIPKDVDVVL